MQPSVELTFASAPALFPQTLQDGEKEPGAYRIEEPDRDSLLSHLSDYVQTGDTILVKASHFMQFEKVVAALQEM